MPSGPKYFFIAFFMRLYRNCPNSSNKTPTPHIYCNMGKRKQSKLSQVKENVKSNLVESLELPMDIMYGSVIITAMGRNQVLVENYKGIIEYTQEKIRLQTKTCQVTIQGKRLLVEYYTNEEMKITGYIQGIIYGT